MFQSPFTSTNTIFQYTMISNKMQKALVILLAALCFISCNKEKADAPSGFSWAFIPRDCEYLFIRNAYVDSSLYYSLSEKQREEMLGKGYQLIMVKQTETSETPARYFCLTLDVTNYTLEMIKNLPDGEYSTSLMSSPDQTMENIMDEEMRHGYRTSKSSMTFTRSESSPMAYIKYIEYRKIELKSLKVMSDVTMFGNKPGSDLSGHFEIFGDKSNTFFFDYRRNYLGRLETGMGIEEYLALRPIVNPSLYLHLKDVPPETPLKTDLIVEMELEGGVILRDTTTVTLTR